MLAILIGMGTAGAAGCPAGTLGVSRTIVVDPSEHIRLGSMQYGELLPLRDREVVLTFDDGPLPPYTNRILDTLASECVKATFFMVGRMVRAYPSLVERIHSDGHTVANHSQNHPFTFNKMTVDQAAREIEDGFASLRSVLGDRRAVAPFFRIPGLLRQSSVEQYLAAHGYMTWSVDFTADDWTRINSQEIVRRAIERIELHRKGILLLHDIQPATALALPELLRELSGPRVQDRPCGPGDRRSAKDGDRARAMGSSSNAGAEAVAAHAGRVRERRCAGPAGAEPGQFRYPEFRHSGHQGGAGTDLRAADRARRRDAAADGRHLAEPDGLFGVRRDRSPAGARRAAFQVFTLVRDRSPGEIQARVEKARRHRRRKTAPAARHILAGREPSALGGPPIPYRASAEQHSRAASAGTVVSAAA